MSSPWSKMDRYRWCAPELTGVDALRRGVAPSYVVPAALASVMDAAPAALTVIGCPVGSNAKLCGAVTLAAASVVQSEVSSSATKASLTLLPTNSGYSSERKRKSTVMQFTPAGTFRSTLRIVTSKSLTPRTLGPPRPTPSEPLLFG